MHLGQAHFLADLGLCHLRAEAELEESALPLIQLGQVRFEGLEVLGQCEGGVFIADQVGDESSLLLAAMRLLWAGRWNRRRNHCRRRAPR